LNESFSPRVRRRVKVYVVIAEVLKCEGGVMGCGWCNPEALAATTQCVSVAHTPRRELAHCLRYWLGFILNRLTRQDESNLRRLEC